MIPLARPIHRPPIVRVAIAAALVLVSSWSVRPARAADPPATSAAPAAPAPATQASPATNGGQGSDSHRTAALVGAGVAVAGLVAGTVYGVLAISRKNDAQSVCPSSACATEEGVSKWSSAQSAANISTLMFVVAGLGALEAAVFWFTPSANDTASTGGGTRTQVGIGPGMLQLKGAW